MWWRVVRASRFLGVAPWDLAKAPLFWLNAAEAAQQAEAEAERRKGDRPPPGRRPGGH